MPLFGFQIRILLKWIIIGLRLLCAVVVTLRESNIFNLERVFQGYDKYFYFILWH